MFSFVHNEVYLKFNFIITRIYVGEGGEAWKLTTTKKERIN